MEQHGEYRIEKQGQILLLDIKGPWNKELIVAYRAELLTTIHAMSPHPWANILIIRGVAILTPDAEQELISVVKLRKKLGLACTALVIGNIEPQAKLVSCTQFERIYRAAGINFCFFEQLPQAYAWLAEQGFERMAV